ncbi:hypothetical protein [Prosthecodimorpha hirschii]|uniref:hypothetical protein n=1 Tax=Prosthecodimorpha hirschii TaxID=665126 RepID=UPI00112CF65B|nr:hypothetical protein [Prosthecomicrobium hirschii]
MMPIIRCGASLVFLINLSSAAIADCLPQNFLLEERMELISDHSIRLAFIESMSQSQFDNAKKKFSGGASFPINGIPINGYSNLESAKAAGRSEASARGFTLDQSGSTHLIANRLSESGANAYIACLKEQGPGISLWVANATGNRFQVAVLFRPGDSNLQVRPFGLDNFKMISKLDKEFVPSTQQNLMFVRKSDGEGSIEIVIGKYRQSLIFPKRERLREVQESTHFSENVAQAATGGKNQPYGPKTVTACTTPPSPDWNFIPGTEGIIVLNSTTNVNSWTIVQPVSVDKLCWSVTARTGRKGDRHEITAKASVRMQRSVK